MQNLTIVDLRNLITKVNHVKNISKKDIKSNTELFNSLQDDLKKAKIVFENNDLETVLDLLKNKVVQLQQSPDYWNPDIYKKNAKENMAMVKKTIDDIDFTERKIMVCGRSVDTHPDFLPRFSTPTTNIESNLYITVDHDPIYEQYITRKGDYAICLIVDPVVPKRILELGGQIFWFSPEYMDYGIPKLSLGEVHKGNSGLAAINLASYLKAKFILISGIQLSEKYEKFLLGKNIIFKEIEQRGSKIFSLDGVLAEKITYANWCAL